MKKITIKQIGKAKVNPIFDGLPDSLKDIKNFEKADKAISSIMVSDHKHANIQMFMKCKRCQAKKARKDAMIKELGFKDYNQYQNWKRVMGVIRDKQDLKFYGKK